VNGKRKIFIQNIFIENLKNRADIVAIIKPYVALTKKGANWMGCCPFHQDKTPSFSVHSEKGFYKCFGCGKGGDVYSFFDGHGRTFVFSSHQASREDALSKDKKRKIFRFT
jgi:DNA primase catalytic core